MSVVTLRSKSYSSSNSDIYEVSRSKRRRRVEKGFEKLVFGRTIRESEFNLNSIREKIRSNQKIKLENNRIGSFEIKLWV